MSKEKSYWQQDIKAKEYAVAAAESIFLTVIMTYLFYASVWALPLLSAVGVLYYSRKKDGLIQRKQKEFRKQFQDALETLASALRIGYSMENAIKEVQRQMQVMYTARALISKEFTYMSRQLDLNLTAEQVLREFAVRTDLEEVRSFTAVFTLAKRSGGDSIAIIRNAVRQIGDRMDVEREIETILSAKKLEFKVMCIIPLGIIGYMRISFPEFMTVLYRNMAGALFMSICLLGYLAAVSLGEKIIAVKV